MYDVIVVGARCAGASTALLLSRQGYQVLLVDKSTFPSDLVMSTHLIWQPGVAKLTSWGLGDALTQTGTPALTRGHFDFGEVSIDAQFPPSGDTEQAYAPRRAVLDELLVQAATKAGAQLWEATTVDGLLSDDQGTVTGIRGRTRAGARVAARARLVVGADGTHSIVARQMTPGEYDCCPALQGTYFAYWSGVPVPEVQVYPRPGRAVYGWNTTDGIALIGANWVAQDFPRVRADIDGNYHQVIAQTAPELAERLRAGRRESKWIGGTIRGYFRTPYGPGWALVGDAGYQKDPGTAQGITDAFTHAELLADALDAGLSGRQDISEALARYERTRNTRAKPMYQLTCQLATLAPPTPEMEQFYASLAADPARAKQFLGVFAGSVPVSELFPTPEPVT
jgi:flavin-dependent dehydrogenase